jgi:putative peptidoglycan lipid II flippase
LNALGKFTFPGLAQLTVPAVAITGLWAFGDRYGIKVIAIGMFIGQLLNLVLVSHHLNKMGYSIKPKWSAHYSTITAFLPQYAPQVASALFIAAMPLVGSALASTLASGSVATFNLGNKVVLFATGLIGTVITTVMLPYFSSLIAKNHLLEVRRELCFFLVATTLLTVPAALILYLLIDDAVALVFEGGALGASDVNTLGRVIKFGIIQLPFFTCGMLLLRFAVANRQSMMVMLASFVGLGIGMALSYPLMSHMGVAGIALATTFASVCSSGVLLMLIHRYGHIRWMDILMLGLNWSLFLTLTLCLHYKSYAGVFVTIVALVLLFTSQWRMLFSTTEIPRMSHNEA